EQLCINYANERLQAQFNDLVFAKEQRMYEREGIEWKYIEYPDNAPCLQLLEDRPHGLWSLLDEECILPKGSNEGWITKLYQTYIPFDEMVSESRRHSNPERSLVKRPSATKLVRPFYATYGQQVEYQFVIGHFAGKVMYELDAFLQKNQDALPTEAIALCNGSSNTIVQSLLPNMVKSQSTKSAAKGPGSTPKLTRVPSSLRAASVSSQFRTQLDDLIQVIGSTQARYIRCIKSNDSAQPRLLSKARAVQQLRSGGVLEAVRIARAGYAVRVDHSNFIEQYSFMLPRIPNGSPSTKKKRAAMQSLPAKQQSEHIAAAILLQLQIPDTGSLAKNILSCAKFQRAELQDACGRAGFQLGHSKVFFRKELYNELRRLRSIKLKSCATQIQRIWRGYVDRTEYKAACKAVIVMQHWMRAVFAVKRQRNLCARIIQTSWRRYIAQHKFDQVKYRVCILQRLWRSRKLWFVAKAERTAILRAREAEERARKVEERAREAEDIARRLKENEALAHKEEIHVRNVVAVHPKSDIKVTKKSQGPSEPQHVAERFEAEVYHVAETANAALVENLTLQNEKLRLELELLRQQSALQMQMTFAASRPMEYHAPPSVSSVAPPQNDLEFAHQQIVSLSQQLLTTQIKYSNLLMDYNENLSGYDADRPSLSDEAFSMVDDLAVPCPETLECAQEQLRTLLRKLHIAKEKLKNLETEMMRNSRPRCESIEGVDFLPRKSNEWRPHFYSHAEEYEYDVMSEVDEYEQRCDEMQRQLDGLKNCVSQRKSLPSLTSLTSTVSTRAPSTTSSDYHDYPRRYSMPASNTQRLSYQVPSVNKWARDSVCFECKTSFTWFTRRHHCRLCGNSFCHEHSNRRACLSGCGSENENEPVRVCDVCFVEICLVRKEELASRRDPYRPYV
ncbi:myosin, partial [Thraustotheca clavata]